MRFEYTDKHSTVEFWTLISGEVFKFENTDLIWMKIEETPTKENPEICYNAVCLRDGSLGRIFGNAEVCRLKTTLRWYYE